jgi:hypothetical protein
VQGLVRPGKLVGVFFVVHLAVAVGYYFLSSQFGSGSGSAGVGGGSAGMGAFGGILGVLLLFSKGRPLEPTVLPLIFLLNSALTAAVATGILVVVRRLRAA